MSNQSTKHMLEAYSQFATPTLFFSGFFDAPRSNFYSSETVEFDIERTDEDVAIVVTDLSTGYRMNEQDMFTNKEFKAPVIKEAIAINSYDLLKRNAGQNPFQSPAFRANLMLKVMRSMSSVEKKIRRTMELQASQVMQTGVITLTDENGNALYTIDFKPKATHFPTAANAWSVPAGDPVGDISSLAEVIRNDGLDNPDQLIMGIDAFESFIKNADVQARYDNRRIDLGTIAPMQMNGAGGSFRGIVEIGNYSYDIWTYGGRYKHPQTGLKTQFMDPNKCIVRASSGRMDATFGAIPNIGTLLGTQATNLLPELPGRLSNAAGGMDLHTNAWVSNDGQQLFAGVGSRPLMIPTAIDTFGCIDGL